MKVYHKIIMIMIVVLLPLTSFAQTRTSKAKWNEYEDWELNMTSFEADSSASAVILSEYQYMSWARYNTLEVHRRVKLLNPSSYDEYATVVIPHGKKTRISGLKAQTVFINDQGEVEKHKLSRRDFVKEEIIGDYYETTFTFTHLRPGAIIEYSYEERDPGLEGWSFQHSEPTMWSEFEIVMPAYYELARYSKGSAAYYIHDKQFVTTANEWNDLEERWVMRNVPALRVEPFMTDPSNYRAKVGFYISQIKPPPGWGRIRVQMGNWAHQAKVLERSESFGGVFGRGRSVRRKAREIVDAAGASTDQEKMIACYNYLKDNIRSIDYASGRILVKDASLGRILDAAEGSFTEINMLLIDLLKTLQITAEPALISTRDNGTIDRNMPTFRQFNRVLAGVTLGEEFFLLDATDPNRPWNLLPPEDMTDIAFMAVEENPRFMRVNTTGKINHKAIVTAVIDEDGVLTAEVNTLDKDYAALATRSALRDENDNDRFVYNYVLDGLIAGEVENMNIENAEDIEAPIKTSATIIAEDAVQMSGDKMYVTPHMFDRHDGNPFSLPTRKYAIDFVLPVSKTYMFALTIPEGYEVDEVPANKAIRLPDNAGVLQRIVQVQGDKIQFILKQKLNTVVFEADNYTIILLDMKPFRRFFTLQKLI